MISTFFWGPTFSAHFTCT